jgi:hypothetical protein
MSSTATRPDLAAEPADPSELTKGLRRLILAKSRIIAVTLRRYSGSRASNEREA